MSGRDADMRAAARASAEEAARRAQVAVQPLRTLPDLHEAGLLFSDLWRSRDGCPEISDDLLKAFDLAGSYISGAFEAGSGGRLVGAALAFASVRPPSEPPELHSHVTGAAPGRLGGGIGFALKLHQRSWALERGIGIVTWTFDPLVRRNSVFNLAKLGASATAYLRNVYGQLTDVLNRGGGESDRLWARWLLSDETVVAAAAGRRRLVSSESLPCRLGPGKGLRPERHAASGQHKFTVKVPDDIEALRREDPALASEWRAAIRDVLGETMEQGGRLLGVDRGGDLVIEEAVR